MLTEVSALSPSSHSSPEVGHSHVAKAFSLATLYAGRGVHRSVAHAALLLEQHKPNAALEKLESLLHKVDGAEKLYGVPRFGLGDDEYFRLRLCVARANAAVGKFDRSVSIIEDLRIERLSPQLQFETLVTGSTLYIEHGNAADAAGILKPFVSDSVSNLRMSTEVARAMVVASDALLQSGLALESTKYSDPALIFAQRHHNLPIELEARAMRGRAAFILGHDAAALEHFRLAVVASAAVAQEDLPLRVFALEEYGVALLRQGHFSSARDVLEQTNILWRELRPLSDITYLRLSVRLALSEQSSGRISAGTRRIQQCVALERQLNLQESEVLGMLEDSQLYFKDCTMREGEIAATKLIECVRRAR